MNAIVVVTVVTLVAATSGAAQSSGPAKGYPAIPAALPDAQEILLARVPAWADAP